MGELPHVIDALLGLVESHNPVPPCFSNVDDAFVLAEGEAGGRGEASESNRPNALLLHVNHKERSTGVRCHVLAKGSAIAEENVAR